MVHRSQKILLPLLALFLVAFSWLGGFAPITEAAVGLTDFRVSPLHKRDRDQGAMGNRVRKRHCRLSGQTFCDQQLAKCDHSDLIAK